MSDDLHNIARAAVVLFGFILIISGFADLTNVLLSEQILAVIFGVLGTGLIKIVVGGIFVLVVIYPRAIGDFRNFLKGK
jgi:small-conductance mechanosensitive channel